MMPPITWAKMAQARIRVAWPAAKRPSRRCGQGQPQRVGADPPTGAEQQDDGEGQADLGQDVDDLGPVVGPAAVLEGVVVAVGQEQAGADDAGQEEGAEDEEHLGVGAAGPRSPAGAGAGAATTSGGGRRERIEAGRRLRVGGAGLGPGGAVTGARVRTSGVRNPGLAVGLASPGLASPGPATRVGKRGTAEPPRAFGSGHAGRPASVSRVVFHHP